MRFSVRSWRFFSTGMVCCFILGVFLGYSLMAHANSGQRWEEEEITVYDQSGWTPSLQVAIQQWNNTGLGVGFRLVQSLPADVVVRVDSRKCQGTCAAMTEFIGRNPRSQQMVSTQRGPQGVERFHPTYTAVRVMVHELGHVIGLEHRPGCRIMSKHFARDCQIWNESKAFVCGPLRSDIKEAKAMYGSRPVVHEPTFCRF